MVPAIQLLLNQSHIFQHSTIMTTYSWVLDKCKFLHRNVTASYIWQKHFQHSAVNDSTTTTVAVSKKKQAAEKVKAIYLDSLYGCAN